MKLKHLLITGNFDVKNTRHIPYYVETLQIYGLYIEKISDIEKYFVLPLNLKYLYIHNIFLNDEHLANFFHAKKVFDICNSMIRLPFNCKFLFLTNDWKDNCIYYYYSEDKIFTELPEHLKPTIHRGICSLLTKNNKMFKDRRKHNVNFLEINGKKIDKLNSIVKTFF